MGQTVVQSNAKQPFGKSPMAQKKWSATLLAETISQSYWTKFEGTNENSIIQVKTELESGPGDNVSFDLSAQLRGSVTHGDDRLQGKEEALKFYTDEVIIDQMRKSVSAGGRMTRKRTAHDLRKVAKDRLAEYWSAYLDQLKFMTLSGSRGINEDFIEGLNFNGVAKNELRAPDSQHILFGGSAQSKATLTESDKMTKNLIERVSNRAKMMRARDPSAANLLPININGGKHYIMVMTPDQEYDLRSDVGTGGWLEVQKAAASCEGSKNAIFKGGLGMIDNVVLHSHESVIRFNDYGAGGNVHAARALFLGRQAAVMAYGSTGGSRFDWKEETADYGNEPTVAAGVILGVSKTRFNKRDFGVIAVDTAAKDPNAIA